MACLGKPQIGKHTVWVCLGLVEKRFPRRFLHWSVLSTAPCWPVVTNLGCEFRSNESHWCETAVLIHPMQHFKWSATHVKLGHKHIQTQQTSRLAPSFWLQTHWISKTQMQRLTTLAKQCHDVFCPDLCRLAHQFRVCQEYLRPICQRLT